MQADTPGARPPEIPDYGLVRRIGRGAYGEVWMVRGVTGLLRAAKVVWRDRFSESAPYEREFRAIRLYSEICLDDPRLLRVLHVGRNDAAGCFHYIMELADSAAAPAGGDAASSFAEDYEAHTLRLDLARRRRFPIAEALRITADLARALHSLHRRGLVHRDIKPSNVLFIGGMPKLGDVGLVTDAREGATSVGTPGYQPPLHEEPGHPAADLYALGKVLYELATGNPALDCPKLPREPFPVSVQRQWLELNEVILKATEPQSARRYQSAEELLRDLLQVESGTSIRGWLRLRRQARWLRTAAVVLLGVAGVALGIAATQRRLTARAMERLEQARYSAAQSRIAAGRHREARGMLDEIRADRRGEMPPEWSLLYGLALGAPDRVYPGPAEPVVQLVADATGGRLAARSQKEDLWVWDAQAPEGSIRGGSILGLGPLEGRDALPMRLVGSGGSNRLEGVLGIPGTWTLLSWTEGNPWILASRDTSRSLLEIRSRRTFEIESSIRLTSQDPGSWTEFETVSRDAASVLLVRQPGNGESGETILERWGVVTGALDHSLVIGKNPKHMSASPDHHRVVVAYGTTGAPRLYHLRSGTFNLLSEPQLQRGCNVVAFSPQGDRVACGGTDGIIRLWSAADARLLDSLCGHAPMITALAWSEDGHSLFSADSLGEIRRWTMGSKVRVSTRLSGFWNGDGGDVCLGTESPRWAATLTNGTVGVWDDARQGPPRWVLSKGFEPIAFSNDDSVLWTYDRSAWVRSWSLETGKPGVESGPVVPPGKEIGRIVVDPRQAVAFGIAFDDASIYRWNLRTHRLEAAATNAFKNAYMLQYAPTADLLVGLRENDAIYGWNGADLSLRFQTPGSTNANAANGLALSRDGRWIAAGSHDGSIRILDVQQGAVIQTLRAQSAAVLALTFTPDGDGVVVSHQSGVISWLDRRTGKERIQLDPAVHQGGALRVETFRVGFSADGRMLVALTNGGDTSSELLRWVAPPESGSPAGVAE